ncbi:LytR C-terminal domain-containing protein [Pseudonocardia sp. CA-142604]|uniref:LytR C-terminal domain-containing protein n=1 Tax=Pseudonocardia sp. CA-142604 TaxID=3240024 RepID=UPI003D8D0E04
MTSPASSGGPSPLRIGGLALIGIGIIAGVVGLATYATGGGGSGSDQQAAPPPLSTQVSITPEPSAPAVPQATPTPAASAPAAPAPTSLATVPVPSFTPTPTSAPGGNASSSQAGADSGGTSRTGAVRAPVRVYNNSTITGLAARAAADFRNAGWQVEEVGNYPSGIIPTSTVYYRPGTSEQQAAQALADQFSLRVEPRFSGLDEASPGLIVIATNDYQGR